MARPPLPIGAHGEISVRQVTLKNGKTVYEARCYFRAADGSMRRPRRTGKSKTAAVTALKGAVARGDDAKATVRFAVVAESWFADFELQVQEGRKSPKTRDIYRTYLDRHVLPAMAKLQMVEVNTVRCQALIDAKRRAGAKDDLLSGVRNVLNAVCNHAVRMGELSTNPVREVARLQRTGRKRVRALTPAERADLLAKLAADEKAREYDLADVLRGLLATGVRVSELLGCSGDDLLLGSGKARSRLLVEHRTSRIKGQGVVRARRSGTTKGEEQTLWLPAWVVPMLRERKLASGGEGPLFPDPLGRWRPNDSVSKPLREALDRLGYDWVTSHVMRKTVANVLKEAGFSVRQIADQLGQRSTAVTERHYLEAGAANQDQAAVLDDII